MEYAIKLLESNMHFLKNYVKKLKGQFEENYFQKDNENIKQLEKAIEILKNIPADFDYTEYMKTVKGHYAEQLKPVKL